MVVGIDLGTTNSLIAYFDEGEAKVIPNRLGQHLTPSVVSVDEEGTVFVGETARERRMLHPDETAEVFKRSMGSQKDFKLGERHFSAEELSSFVLRSLKEDAEEFLGEQIDEAVISVPAYFNDTQRKATKRAGELAGLKVERIISEPTAAAIAYGAHQKDADSKFLVFDLGGGTFDVSVLELFDTIMEVRAVAGDNFLGGEDFTQVLVQMFLNAKELEQEKLDEKTLAHITKQAEETKKKFSEEKKVVMSCKVNDEILEEEITLDEYERACSILLGKIRKPIERSLTDANIKLKDIDEVLLVGGATKLPIVRRFVSKLFGRLPNTSINPDEVVAMGAAIQVAMKQRNEAVREMILTDVCPFTLGTDVVVGSEGKFMEAGHFLPIIERNTVIPVSRTERLYTVSDNQSQIRVKVLQGESRYVKNNVYLGELLIDVPKKKAGEEAIDVTYTYDVNALLEVEVTVVSNGEKKRIVIQNEETDLTPEEIDARFAELKALKIHPRDQEENRLLMFRGERIYEESVGNKRFEVEYHLRQFEEVLNRQDRHEIEEAREVLKKVLDKIEKQDEE